MALLALTGLQGTLPLSSGAATFQMLRISSFQEFSMTTCPASPPPELPGTGIGYVAGAGQGFCRLPAACSARGLRQIWTHGKGLQAAGTGRMALAAAPHCLDSLLACSLGPSDTAALSFVNVLPPRE